MEPYPESNPDALIIKIDPRRKMLSWFRTNQHRERV
jgi:hypothetical protein